MSDSIWEKYQLQRVSPEGLLLAEKLHCSPIIAQLLWNRGIHQPETAQSFLDPYPTLNWPAPPFLEALIQRFTQAIAQHEKIVIHGDYDADGLTGTTILYEFLLDCGAQVKPFLPTRSLGYGLNQETVKQLAQENTRLIITVDCGISNCEEISLAKSLGIDVVITDHHGLPQELPDTPFILHPLVLKLPEVANLAGVGVAYWLMTLLYPHFAQTCRHNPEYYLDLAAIGTIADMTPLVGLNRDLVKRGLLQLRKTRRPGLKALFQMKHLNPDQLTETDLSFRMIPSLNAAGRIQSPILALDLLLAPTLSEAEVLALHLDELNQIRRQLCNEVQDDILRQLKDERPQLIFLANETWLHGVLGIVCSKLVEIYHCPVFLLAIEGNIAKASVRAPEGFHVLKALNASEHLLEKYGGHAMAGGFSVRKDKLIPLELNLREYMQALEGTPAPKPKIEIEIPAENLSLELYSELRQLAPFGIANPLPIFASRRVKLEDLKPDRKNQVHTFARLAGSKTKVKAWYQWQATFQHISTFDLVYQLESSEWNNQRFLELNCEFIGSSSAPPVPSNSSILPREQTPDKAWEFFPQAGYVFVPGQAHYQVWTATSPPGFNPLDLNWQDQRQEKPNPKASPSEQMTLVYTEFPGYLPPDCSETQEISLADVSQIQIWGPILQISQFWGLLSKINCQEIQICLPDLPAFQLNFQGFYAWKKRLESQRFQPLQLKAFPEFINWNPFEIQLYLKSLCDLGILIYDEGDYRIAAIQQKVDLRQSHSLIRYKKFYQNYQNEWLKWSMMPLRAIVQETQAGLKSYAHL